MACTPKYKYAISMPCIDFITNGVHTSKNWQEVTVLVKGLEAFC